MKKIFLCAFFLLFVGRAYSQNVELIGHFSFNNTLDDNSDNNYHGTAINTLSYQDGVDCEAVVVEDNKFNGVKLNPGLINGLNDFSISFHGKITKLNNSNNFLSGASNFSSNDFLIGYNAVGFYPVNGWGLRIDNIYHPFEEDTTMNDFQWHHIVIVRNEGVARLFIDATQVGEDISVSQKVFDIPSDGLVLGQDQDCIGGCFQDNENWSGSIDELRFFNGALTENGVDSLYKTLVCSPNSIESPEDVKRVRVIPNPTSGSVRIERNIENASSISKIELYTINGRLLMKESVVRTSMTLDLKSFQASSVYVLVVYDEHKKVAQVERIILKR